MIEKGRGGAIVLTGSTLGLVGRGGNGRGGSTGYCASKHAIVGLGRTWAHWLAPHNIRVNSVHPAGANTPMVINEAVAKLFASAPASSGADVGNLLDVQLIEAVDVSNAIAWLVSDEARYVTAVAPPGQRQLHRQSPGPTRCPSAGAMLSPRASATCMCGRPGSRASGLERAHGLAELGPAKPARYRMFVMYGVSYYVDLDP